MDMRDPGDYDIEDYQDLFSLNKPEIGSRGVPYDDGLDDMGEKSLWSQTEAKSLKYTKPDLRNRLKNEIMAGGKGGKPGQWSARKAQLLALEYRKRGGGYRGKLGKTQRKIRKWTREKWTTSDGKPANRPGGMRRYLPAAAWRRLSAAEKAATNRKKIAGGKAGRQFVANTAKARTVGRNVRRSRGA